MHRSYPRLYLHLGSHKTGTTALQAFSVANRNVLWRHGLYYPDFGPISPGPRDGHHALAHAFSSTPDRLSLEQAQALIARWKVYAGEENLTVVISAEAIYRHVLGRGNFWEKRRQYLEGLKAALAGFEVVPVVLFRRPDEYLRSLYQEAVANRSKPLQMPDFADYVAKPPRGIEYKTNADVVTSVFGTLKVLLYEDLAASPGSLGEAFYAALGYPLTEHTPTPRVRDSLSPEETRVKNALNGQLTRRADSQALVKRLRTPAMQAALRDAYPHPPYTLWPNQQCRKAFLASRAEDLAHLQERYLPERETLFTPPVESPLDNPIPPPPSELLEKVAYSSQVGSGLRRILDVVRGRRD